MKEVGLLTDEHPGVLMERQKRPRIGKGQRHRKEREIQPAVAGARDKVTPGGLNG